VATLLVIGGTGFLGAQLCRHGLTNGWQVHATERERDRPGDLSDGIRWHSLDLRDADETTDFVERCGADLVINAAYQQNGPDVVPICADGPAAAARGATATGSRYVHVSTDLVFDGDLGRPYAETDPTSPIMAYGEAKLLGETKVLDTMPTAIVARTSIIYGDPAAPQEQLVQRALTDSSIAFFTDEWRSPVHVADLAAALFDLADSGVSGLVHVGSDERLNRHQFARLLAEHAGENPELLHHRTQDPALGRRPRDVSLDSSLAASTIGWALPGPSKRLR
jgi:dTDP-4-dehydrorhamnose reductase